MLLLLLFSSCEREQNEYYQTILKSDVGHLRGVSIGANISEVKALEDEEFLKDEMPDYLHYDYSINMGNTYTVTYDFSSENELYEIELAVFLDAIEDAGSLFDSYTQGFNRKFGKGREAEDGFTIWNIKNAKSNIELAMINDSQSYGYLSIIVRDLNY